ncbi:MULTISPECIES: tetratricopeptide repeat protein [unclassified Streptomyces]|uniref:tetratricopeptide repeat protein n=1 Tax=unclassified Streptomyces TaxID=2593676 RepID=UPI002E2DA1B1|nr:tetratricopeptide repeat protein [Streptomyces sp. NBC_00223]
MTAPAALLGPCPRDPCPGSITVTGFCDTCLRRPPAAAPDPGPPPDVRPQDVPGPRHAPATAGGLDRDGLVQLPDIPEPALAEIVRTTARPPDGGRRCGVEKCAGTIGVAYDGGPVPDHGFCPVCGTPYSFRPQLRPGDEVGEQYRVLGYLSPGGTGWVYLAEDIQLPDHRVVLKALINTGDAVARRRAVEERRSLTTLHHRDIVRIITSKQHRVAGDAEPTDYIVMEYIGGRPLDQLLRAPDEELAELFGEPFGIDHVLTYGCKILGALEYLHDQGLLYCDMKPENVIHYGREIKVIDLGAVRRIDDGATGLVYTPRFAPPRRERESRGFAVDTDLYTVGRTLQALAARTAPAAGLAARSFDRLIGRATHDEPAARFTSAPQMSRQLWEVLREHRALSGHEQYPERSTRFEPNAVLFGAALGTVPSPAHWTGRTGEAPPDLAIGPPGPQEAARGLPVPIPDPADPAAVLLGPLAAGTPERIAERVRRDPAMRTVEVALWLCRAYLRRPDPGGTEAARWLGEAAALMGPDLAGYDWRLAWHRGLTHLTEGRVKNAQGEFTAVYATVPGEWAPKLALGYCSEALGGRARETEEFYEAVWERDRAQGSAAFGLARVHLRRGDRERAVQVLDQVPSTSRHYDAARIAAVRVLAGRPAGVSPPPAALREAAARLAELRLGEARDRLIAETRENVLAALPADGGGDFPVLPEGDLFAGADSRRRLAELLYGSLRGLADRAHDADERGDLLDRAYAVRPETRF